MATIKEIKAIIAEMPIDVRIDLEQYEPESSAFTAQCVGCGELI